MGPVASVLKTHEKTHGKVQSYSLFHIFCIMHLGLQTTEHVSINNFSGYCSGYCREYGLSFERSDRNIENFDYVSYLWEGKRDLFMKPYERKNLPTPISKKNKK